MSSTVSEVKRGRKESHVWDHYIKEPLDSGHYTAKCHYCIQTWSRGRPEILKSHLALYCKEVPLAIKSEYMEMLAIGSTSTNRKQKLDTDSSAAEIDADKKDRIDQALIRYFVCCGIPFSTVNHPYFIDFVQSAHLQEDIIQSLTKGGGLKTSVKTRWSTAWDCCDSIIHLENNLKNQLRAVLAPAKRAVQAIEANASNMVSIFMELIKMAVAIKQISNYLDLDF
ncbi:20390_t:CDS:2 [Rhizophagus irregularis]|nr:20390_t:CDS:2 [Rhizophagus irregularis]